MSSTTGRPTAHKLLSGNISPRPSWCRMPGTKGSGVPTTEDYAMPSNMATTMCICSTRMPGLCPPPWANSSRATGIILSSDCSVPHNGRPTERRSTAISSRGPAARITGYKATCRAARSGRKSTRWRPSWRHIGCCPRLPSGKSDFSRPPIRIMARTMTTPQGSAFMACRQGWS